MRAIVVKRGAEAKAQVVGEFVWEDGQIVTRAPDTEQAIMEGMRPELDGSTKKAARASMLALARLYTGSYLWVRYES